MRIFAGKENNMIETNRRYKMNEQVYIFAEFSNGLPHVLKGRVCGVVKGAGIYEYVYQIETAGTLYFRFPDTIFRSVDEIKDELNNLVVE